MKVVHFKVATALQEIGENIRLARTIRRLSLRDMATRLNVAVNTYRKVEEGKPVSSEVLIGTFWVLGIIDRFKDLINPINDPAFKKSLLEKMRKRGVPAPPEKDISIEDIQKIEKLDF